MIKDKRPPALPVNQNVAFSDSQPVSISISFWNNFIALVFFLISISFPWGSYFSLSIYHISIVHLFSCCDISIDINVPSLYYTNHP